MLLLLIVRTYVALTCAGPQPIVIETKLMSSPSSSSTADSAATMAGRRSCVNSLWSGTERVRIGERLKATLAGILELDLLRGQHLDMIDAELELKDTSSTDTTVTVITDKQEENLESAAIDGSAISRRQQVSVYVDPDLLTRLVVIKYECILICKQGIPIPFHQTDCCASPLIERWSHKHGATLITQRCLICLIELTAIHPPLLLLIPSCISQG